MVRTKELAMEESWVLANTLEQQNISGGIYLELNLKHIKKKNHGTKINVRNKP